ncbi:MAG: sensor histidine kinase, partial [Alphaproteobacteria bacterium]
MPDNVLPTHRDAYRLLAPLPDPVLALDSGQRVVYANAAAKRLFPILNEVRFGLLLAQILKEPAVLRAVDQVLNSTHHKSDPVTISLGKQVPKRMRVTATRTDFAHGPSAPLCLLVLHDETAAWRAEEMRADFIANASHELRTPLASLLGYVETLQGPAKNDPQAAEQFLGIMAEQARRMTRLIDDLLSLSRIEQDEHQAPETRLPLGHVIDGAINVLAPMFDEAGVGLVTTMPDSLRQAEVLGDKDLLVQVFQNLLDNAIKYGAEGGRIELSGTLGSTTATIRVRDFGGGIAPENLTRLTERFYRVDKKASRSSGGTGLGLAIVKHIVNQHLGHLEITSELGKGTTFTVTLPLASTPHALQDI